jgi:peptidyl-prolyl cis-trans isomerase A (cyclophilin A)
MNKKTTPYIFGLIGLILVALIGFLIYSANRPTTDTTASNDKTTPSTMSQAELNKLDLPQLTNTVGKDEAEVQIQTTAGNINIKLFPKLAPMAVQNFLTLAKENYYNNNEFFRVLNNFMIQTGDPTNAGTSSKVVPAVNGGQPFNVEPSNQLYNIRGALSLANTGQPSSSSSQFFIVQNTKDMSGQIQTTVPDKIKAAYAKGGYPSLDGSYTVFGQVIAGMDIVDKIAAGEVQANPQSGEKSSPVHPEKITGVKVLKDWKF